MLVARNATDLILIARITDINGDPITGIAYDDPLLSVAALVYGYPDFATLVLADGVLGEFIPNSWVQLGGGNYQFCPANALIVSGRSTIIRASYDGRDLYGHINAIGSTVDQPTLLSGLLEGLSSVSITRIGPEFDPATKTITLIAGDDYLVTNDSAITFAVSLPGIDLTGASAVFATSQEKYKPTLLGSAELLEPETEPKIRLQWTRAQTLQDPDKKYTWGVAILDAGKKVKTVIAGPLILKAAPVDPAVVSAALASE